MGEIERKYDSRLTPCGEKEEKNKHIYPKNAQEINVPIAQKRKKNIYALEKESVS